jgi:hypothetical protein
VVAQPAVVLAAIMSRARALGTEHERARRFAYDERHGQTFGRVGPVTFLIDRTGKIADAHAGIVDKTV